MAGTGEGFGQQQAPDGEAPALQPTSTVETEARAGSMLNNKKLFKDSSSQFFFVVGRDG